MSSRRGATALSAAPPRWRTGLTLRCPPARPQHFHSDKPSAGKCIDAAIAAAAKNQHQDTQRQHQNANGTPPRLPARPSARDARRGEKQRRPPSSSVSAMIFNRTRPSQQQRLPAGEHNQRPGRSPPSEWHLRQHHRRRRKRLASAAPGCSPAGRRKQPLQRANA